MIIKLILIGLLASLIGYAVSQAKRVPVVSAFTIAAAVAAVVVVVFPDISTDIAELVGVGRGADLIFYLFIILTFMTIFILYIRLRRTEDTVTEMARAIALMDYRAPENDR